MGGGSGKEHVQLLLAVLHQLPQQFLPLGEQGRVPQVPHGFQGVQVGFLPNRREMAGELVTPGEGYRLVDTRHFRLGLGDL